MTPSLPGEALNERPVEEATNDRDKKEEPDPQPGQMHAGDAALLAELLVARGQPRKGKDQPPKSDSTDTGTHPDHQGRHHQPES